jgi:PAS domain S-box-containing protein
VSSTQHCSARGVSETDARDSKLRLALRIARLGTFEWLVQEDQIVWSPETEALYGLPAGGGGDRFADWLAWLVPEDRERIRREFEECLAAQREEHTHQFRVRLADGSARWMEGHARFFYDATGRAERVIGVHADIHERKRNERRSDFVVQLGLAVRPLEEPRAIADMTVQLLGDFLQADRCAYAGFEPDEDIFTVLGNHTRGMPAMEGKFQLSEFGAELARSQREGRPFAIDDTEVAELDDAAHALFRQTGIRAVIAVPLKKEGKLVAGMAVHHATPRAWSIDEIELVELAANSCWESIERARVAAELRASERRLRLALTSARMVAWEVDPVTGKAEVLDNAAEVLGTPSATLESTEAGFASMHPEDEVAHRELFARTMAECGSHVTQFRMLRPDGTVVWIEERAYSICRRDGKAKRFVGIMIDITERKRAEEELRRAHELLADKAEHLESLVQQRTARLQETIAELEAMSYSIAHDLRAPLRSLEGFSRIVLDEHSANLAPTAQDYLRRIARAAERMDRLTRDVLSYSRVAEAAAARERVDVELIVHDLVETYPQLGPSEADIEIAGPLPPVLGNLALISQVFSNLLGNAVKFVAPGIRPRVQVSAERRGEHGERARFSIADNGVGVPAAQRHKIFGIFERLSLSYEGTGIGLAIAKKAVERMGGSIGVDARPEGGSVFWVELPAAKE